MAYIGKTPTKAPLTSSDIANDIINSDHIGDTAISGFSALTSAPADTDEFLISDGGTLKRIDASLVGGGLDNWSESSGNLLPSNASYGIYLGVNSATASNLLDDYEEGTWTPALGNFGGSNESFIDPRYTKIGRLVTVSCQLQIGSFPSDGSTFLITGLPFTVKSGSGTTYGTCAFRYTGTNVLGLTFGGNNTQIESYRIGGGGGQNNYNDFGQSESMGFVAQYETDS